LKETGSYILSFLLRSMIPITITMAIAKIKLKAICLQASLLNVPIRLFINNIARKLPVVTESKMIMILRLVLIFIRIAGRKIRFWQGATKSVIVEKFFFQRI